MASFYPTYEQLFPLKIKVNKLIVQKLCFRQYYITEKLKLKGSVSGLWIRTRFFTRSGSATLVFGLV